MKKLLIFTTILFTLIVFTTVSCKKDKALEEELIGKWEMASIFYQYYNVAVFVSDETEAFEVNEMVLEIISGGTGKTYYYGTLQGEYTWTLDGNQLTITITGDAKVLDTIEFEVSIDGDVLTMVQTEDVPVKGAIYTKVVSTYTLNRKQAGK